MRFQKDDLRNPERITKIIIEPKDLIVEGMGVSIQVEGYKGSPEEIDPTNNHIYIEEWKGNAQIVVWNNNEEPEVFKLTESEETLADHDLFMCEICNKIFDIDDSIKEEEGLVCEDCSDQYKTLSCGHRTHIEKAITHNGITCCENCLERIK